MKLTAAGVAFYLGVQGIITLQGAGHLQSGAAGVHPAALKVKPLLPPT